MTDPVILVGDHATHDFVLREIEVGARAALHEELEFSTRLNRLNDVWGDDGTVQPDHD